MVPICTCSQYEHLQRSVISCIPPKNFSSSFPSKKVWWSSRLPSSVSSSLSPVPKRGVQPSLCHCSSSSGGAPFVVAVVAANAFAEVACATLSGTGRLYSSGFPSSCQLSQCDQLRIGPLLTMSDTMPTPLGGRWVLFAL
jgi:hypothetical protein